MNIQEIAKKEHKEKLKLASEDRQYYDEKMKEFGLKSMDRFLKYFPNPIDPEKKHRPSILPK